MTNEELIEKFLFGAARGDEESYGFYLRPHLFRPPPDMSLYSKVINTPIANRVSESYFIIIPNDLTIRDVAFASRPDSNNNSIWKRHITEVHEIAKRLRIKFVLSPYANVDHFQQYMEARINCDLLALANDLRTGSYASILRFKEFDLPKPKYGLAGGPDSCFAVPENYQKLMGNIYTLLEWESILGLPKNQVSLIDTDETQSLWRWLIKENPKKKDRELLRSMYTLSRLFSAQQKDKEIDLGTVDISSM